MCCKNDDDNYTVIYIYIYIQIFKFILNDNGSDINKNGL